MKDLNNSRYGKLIAVLVALWFAVSISASALLAFKADFNSLSLTLLIAALVPIALFLLWFAASPSFRQFALSLDARILTIVHSWRIGGFVFLVLASYNILPEFLALPAGWGDIAIGLTAPIVAIYLAKPGHRRSFISWHILGILDLVAAVTTGVLAGPLGYRPGTEAMTVLPLSLIPTFAVPLLVILHIICIAQAARWEPIWSPSYDHEETGRPYSVAR